MFLKIKYSLILCLMSCNLVAQVDCSSFFNQAEIAFKNGDIKEALKSLQETEICDYKNALIKQRQTLQSKLFIAVDKQRKDAEAARDEAQKERDAAETARKEAQKERDAANEAREIARKEQERTEKALIKADSALSALQTAILRNQKIIDAFYFYNSRYALAYKRGKYGYVNPDGNTLIDYKYDNASPFDKITGFALVKSGNTEYYIDTLGNEYLLAREITNLSTKVKALDLSGHGLKEFPSELLKLDSSSLVILNLSKNDLSRIPSDISRFQALKYLNISDTRISNIPEDIGKLGNLRTLEAALNNITDLPAAFSNLTKLEVLNLRLNPLKIFPETLLSLTNLWKLDLAGTHQIEQLPPFFGQMNRLSELDLSNNRLKDCPTSFSQLNDLKYLNLSENDFEVWPQQVLDLPGLQQLDVSRNPLKDISPKLSTMKSLEVLNCISIDLADWPVDQTGFENLQRLNIIGNPIKKIPDTVCRLPMIKEIIVSGNYITEVPRNCTNVIVIKDHSKVK